MCFVSILTEGTWCLRIQFEFYHQLTMAGNVEFSPAQKWAKQTRKQNSFHRDRAMMHEGIPLGRETEGGGESWENKRWKVTGDSGNNNIFYIYVSWWYKAAEKEPGAKKTARNCRKTKTCLVRKRCLFNFNSDNCKVMRIRMEERRLLGHYRLKRRQLRGKDKKTFNC